MSLLPNQQFKNLIVKFSMSKVFLKKKSFQEDKKPKRLAVQDGFRTAHLTRIIKSLEFVFLITNCFGFLLLVIDDLLNSLQFNSRLKNCYTYLIIVEFSLEVLMTYLRAKRTQEEDVTCLDSNSTGSSRRKRSHLHANGNSLNAIKEKLRPILEFLPELFRVHILLIFVQPCLIWTDQINLYLQKLSSMRIYILLRFFLTSNKMENARFKRLLRAFGNGFVLISSKIAISRNYLTSVCWIVIFLVFGLGTIVNENDKGDDSISELMSIIYYVFISITTVGYGQIVVKQMENRAVASLIIVIGICVNSLLTVTVLQAFSMTKQEDNAYYLRQRLELTQMQKDYIGDKFAQLLDMAEMEDTLKEGLTQQERNSVAVRQQCLENQLSGLKFNNPTGEIRQIMFQHLIERKDLSSYRVIRNNDSFKDTIAMYNDDRDVVSELRSEMDRLNACNPISGHSMENNINRTKQKVRAMRYKNNVLNQLIEEEN